MPDIGTISAALSSIQSATEIAKLLKNADSSLEKAEMKLQIADLMTALAESKINISEIQQLIIEKEERIKQLESLLDSKDELVYEEPFYYKKADKENKYCQRCFDSDGKTIRVQKVSSTRGSHKCKVCDTYFGTGRSPRFRSI